MADVLQPILDRVKALQDADAKLQEQVTALGVSTQKEIADVKAAIQKLQDQIANAQTVDPAEVQAIANQLDAISGDVGSATAAIAGSQQSLDEEDTAATQV